MSWEKFSRSAKAQTHCLNIINDIVTDIGSNIRLFADDTSLYIVVDNPLVAAETLNADLEKISRWAAT